MDLPWLVTAALSIVVLYLLYLVGTMNTRYWERRGVVSVYSLPFVGIVFDTFTKKKGFAQILKDIYNKLEGERFGGYFQFLNPVIMFRDPELINQILIKDFVYFEDRGPNLKRASDLFSLGISNLSGDEWRTARHKLTPTFTSGKLKMMFDHINRCGDDAVSHLRDNLNKDINAKEVSHKYIMNVVASVAFGLNIDTLKDGKDNDFYRISSTFFAPSTSLRFKILITMCFPKIRDYANFKLMDEEVDGFFRKITKDIIQYRESTGERRNDFLQLMLDQRAKERGVLHDGHKHLTEDAEDPDDKELLEQLNNTPVVQDQLKSSNDLFSDEFIAAQTFLFISGGSETTATVLSFTLYELAVNEEYQKRVRQEIEDVLSNNDLTYQALKKMTYMDQFLNETMRCHPIAGGLLRVCTKEYKIPGTEVLIDKGTFVFIPISGLHSDPQYFAEPEKFNPDRFEDMDAIPKGVFFNFGDGPRMCIAMRLAMLEMKLYLAKLLLNYEIVLSKKTKVPLVPLKNAFILNVEGGLWVQFKERQK